ncbi:MAG: hypothetical protein ABXS93_05845 [Sulfurimonas sp.]
MKKIFVLFFLLLLGINSYAVDSKGMKWCSTLSGISEMIMKSRQNGVDMEKLMEINTKLVKDGNPDIAFMIIEAYETPRFNTEKVKIQTISDFKNKQYLGCIKAAKSSDR